MPVMDEVAFTAWRRERGDKVVDHRNRYWRAISPGFFEPVHPLARLRPEEVGRPARLCWGYRARLCPADACAANATMPVYLITDPGGYDLHVLDRSRRKHIRRCHKQVELVAFDGPDVLLEQGYAITQEAYARHRYGTLPTAAGFRRWIEGYFRPRRGLLLGGVQDGRLLGFLGTYAVDGTAYIDGGHIGRTGHGINLAAALLVEWSRLCGRSGAVREVMHAHHAREKPSLCRFKEDLGIPVVHLPARAWFAPLTASAARLLRPHKYYRLTGRG